ncbi:uncharacterized protein [Procambarus clarkii]|uniref:uncharacterized protein n=1 Tax=Procambarus clarkii TaxID=6728 RepID=UPI00374297EF
MFRVPLAPLLVPLLLLLLTEGTSPTEGWSSVRESVSVASCRVLCLHMFTATGVERDAKCRKSSDCFMCWNTCGILRHHLTVWSSMCADHTACFPGCQVACSFYMDKAANRRGGASDRSDTPPLRLPAYLRPPSVGRRGRVSWSPPDWSGSAAPASRVDGPASREDVIYVLLSHGDGGWRELAQTSATSTTVPAEVTGVVRVRLLAVNQQGLLAVSEVVLHLDDAAKEHRHLEDVADQGDPSVTPTSEVPYGYRLNPIRTHPPPVIPAKETATSIPQYSSSVFQDSSKRLASDAPRLAHADTAKHTPPDQSYPQMARDLGKSNSSPQAPSVDSSWTVEVVKVDLGMLAEVKVAWEARGSGGVEYLLSWVEESGFVSGHLLTDQVTSEVSLWPGQAYYLQVELVDSHGNPVLQSLATPVIFKSTSVTTSSTAKNYPAYLTTYPFMTAPKTDTVSPTTSTTRQSKTSEEDSEVVGEKSSRQFPVSLIPLLKDDIPHDFVQDQGDIPYGRSSVRKKSSDINEKMRMMHNKYGEVTRESIAREKMPLEVSAREMSITANSESVSNVVVWCVGVGIGALLLLTLCSMIIWMLGRCRKITRSEECTKDRVNGFRGSLRVEVAQKSRRNQATSWTFENFCSANKKSKLVPVKKEVVPVGIDSASLVENYVVTLDSPPATSKIRH